MKWTKFTKHKPQQNQLVDIWVKDRGRENNFEYEGNGFLYDNELDMIREIGEETMNATHWMPVPPEPAK